MTVQPICRWAAAGVLAGSIALTGCGSTEDSTASASRSAAPESTSTPVTAAATKAPAAPPAGLRGSWTRTMRPKDWKDAGSGYPLGTWRFDVDRKGDVDVYLPRKDVVDFTTQFLVDGEHLTIDIPICPGKTNTYSWRASARALTLGVVADDGCAAGAALFGGTWHRRR